MKEKQQAFDLILSMSICSLLHQHMLVNDAARFCICNSGRLVNIINVITTEHIYSDLSAQNDFLAP